MIFSERKNILALFIFMVVGCAACVFVTVMIMALLVNIYLYIEKGISVDFFYMILINLLR